MKRLMLILSIAAAANLGCKSKADRANKADEADKADNADPAVSGSGSSGSAAQPGSGVPGASGAVAISAPTASDPARDLVATATTDLAKLVEPPATPSVNGTRMGKTIDAMVAATRGMSREAWDPAAVVASVGKDRIALFTWVRDHTALVPYRGSLRGASGVLMDRLGNSLDRALLLAELLKKAGLQARLATAQLPADAIARLGASWTARARPPLPVSTAYDESVLGKLLGNLGVDAAAFTAAGEKLDAASAELVKTARARIADQTKAIAALVPAASTPAPGPDPAAFADHWWVQVRDGGAWSDLDPSLPDAKPGDLLASGASETLDPGKLDDDRRHTIVVRVIGEVWQGQSRKEATLLEHAFAPSRYYGQRIVVTNAPLDLPDEDTLMAAKDPAVATRAALIEQTEWLPVLQIGDKPIIKLTVTDEGEVYDSTAGDANTMRLSRTIKRATTKGVGAATGLLGSLPGGPDPAAGSASGSAAPAVAKPPIGDRAAFTAEWIELEVRAPGAPTRTVRRQVFDLLGDGDRTPAKLAKLSDDARLDRALALAGTTELLPVFARIPEAFVTERTVKALSAARPALVELVGLGDKPPSKRLREKLGALEPPPGPLYAVALARFDWSAVADQVYLDRLDLLAEHRRTVISGGAGHWRTTLDIMANDVSVWPGAATDARGARIAQGIADTAAEAFVISCPPGRIMCVRGINTSDAFAATSAGWTVAAPGSSVDATALPPAARALAAADLAAGYAIIVPPGGVATWWRAHPATGETLGMGLHGGNATVEQMVLLTVVGGLGAAACWANSHTVDEAIDCGAAVGFGMLSAWGGIEYTKRRILVWATGIIAGLLAIRNGR
jgi:hypothetical protein